MTKALRSDVGDDVGTASAVSLLSLLSLEPLFSTSPFDGREAASSDVVDFRMPLNSYRLGSALTDLLSFGGLLPSCSSLMVTELCSSFPWKAPEPVAGHVIVKKLVA